MVRLPADFVADFVADFAADFVAGFVADFGIFQLFTSLKKSSIAAHYDH